MQGFQEQILQFRLRVDAEDLVRNFLRLLGIAGIVFQQAVAALLDILAHRLAVLANLRDDVLDKVFKPVPRVGKSLNQAVRVLEEEFAAAHEGCAESVQAIVVPAEHDFLSGALHVRHVHDDIFGLADAVQAPDTLFHKRRVEREVEQHQMVRELEIAAFGTDFRGDEQVCAVLLAEIRGGLVSGHDGHVLMEHGERALTQVIREDGFQSEYNLDRFANEENLVVAVFLQKFLEPHDAFIEFPAIGIARAQESVLLDVRRRIQVVFGCGLHHFAVSRIRFKANLVEFALRESAHALTRIAEHDGTRTHAVHDTANPLACGHGLRVFLFEPRADFRILGDAVVQVFPVHPVIRVGRELGEVVHQLAVFFLLLDKGVVIGKSGRIEHLQAVELTFRMQLERRSRQKQHALRPRKHGIRQHVLVARKAVFTNQVVRLVDDGHVPLRLEQVLDKCGLANQKINRDDDVVTLQERVRLGLVLGDTDEQPADIAFVHQRKELVEAALHFDHPLVLQGLGHNDERTGNTAAHAQGMPYHARLNSLSEADFVAQHKARKSGFATGTMAQVVLVRNHAHARANHATHGRRLPHARKFHGAAAAFERLRRHVSDIAGRAFVGFRPFADASQGAEQVGRPSHLLCGKVGFLHLAATTAHVDHQVIHLAEAFHCERNTLVVFYGFARLQNEPVDGSIVCAVESHLPHKRKQKLDGTALNLGNDSKTQFRF